MDECEAIPGICENGKCVNSMGSFRCDCDKGYLYNEDASACEGNVIPSPFLLFFSHLECFKIIFKHSVESIFVSKHPFTIVQTSCLKLFNIFQMSMNVKQILTCVCMEGV